MGGVLEVSPSGAAELEVFDELVGDDFIDILHGKAAGKEVTLVNAHRRTGSIVFGQAHTTTEKISASLVFVGVHMNSEEDEIFTEAVVEIECLTAWTRQSGISFSMEFEDKQVTSQKLEARLPEKVRASGEGWEHSIEFQWNMKSQRGEHYTYGKDAYFKEFVSLTVQADAPARWNSFNKTISSIQNLVTLAAQRGCALRGRQLVVRSEDGHRWPVDVYFSKSSQWTDEKVDFRKFLFSLNSLGDNLADGLERWFRAESEIGLGMDVLFSLDHTPPTYLENEIFNIASASEGFHAGLFPKSRQLAPALHKEIVGIVKDSFEGHAGRDFVVQSVSRNDPGLKQRFLELASVPDDEAVKNLLGDVDTWAKWLSRARNAIGHMNTGRFEKDVPEDARYRLPYVSRALLHLVLMEKLGISPELQQRAVKDLYEYSARQFKKAVEASAQ